MQTRDWKGRRKKCGIREGKGKVNGKLRTYLLNGGKH